MKDSLIQNWQTLGLHDPKSLTPAIAQIHRGAQFISMVGKHYVVNQPDDSHTNMEWLSDLKVLAGNWVKGAQGNFRLAIKPESLSLLTYDASMNQLASYSLNGQTKDEALSWVKIQFLGFGVDSDLMQMDIHYDIPHHETDDGVAFQLFEQSFFTEMAKHRANSDLILRHFASQYTTASDVRTWPHHYDHGAYIPVAFGENDEHLKSFSIGMGIPDSASNEPYYYITTWSMAGDNEYTNLPKLPAGNWIDTPFHGAVLMSSEIAEKATKEEQLNTVFNFLEAGIKASLAILD